MCWETGRDVVGTLASNCVFLALLAVWQGFIQVSLSTGQLYFLSCLINKIGEAVQDHYNLRLTTSFFQYINHKCACLISANSNPLE